MSNPKGINQYTKGGGHRIARATTRKNARGVAFGGKSTTQGAKRVDSMFGVAQRTSSLRSGSGARPFRRRTPLSDGSVLARSKRSALNALTRTGTGQRKFDALYNKVSRRVKPKK